MGLFNGYLKPGPGVNKNEPKKRGFFLYIDIIWHKMAKLVGANCLYTLTSLPWIVILYFFFGYALINTGLAARAANIIMRANPDLVYEETLGYVLVTLQMFLTVSIFVLWGSGPSSAAYAYVNRCFTRGEPVWVVSDGWDKLKENFKQGMIVVIIDAVVLVLGINALIFYHSFAGTSSFLWMLLEYVTIVVLVVYTMMHSYLYQIMVTFECKTRDLYRNALLLALAKLPGNVLTTAISAGLLTLIFIIINLNPLFAAILVGVFGLCFSRYVTDFYAARVIEKTLLGNMKKKSSKPVIEYLDEENGEENAQ